MDGLRCPILELRQYTLHPDQRDVLITLFDREFVESQEELQMAVLGQFRDLDNPDRFVWLRGFDSMPVRTQALHSFYSGPIWQANRTEANATMIDSDDVLLLRPASPRHGFPIPETARPPVGDTQPPAWRILATIYYRDRPFDDEFVDLFDRYVSPALVQAGGQPLACLRTEYAENTFPALPVRTGEHVFVWFARFDSAATADAFDDRLSHVDSWPAEALSDLSSTRLRLAPTARSLLR